MKKAYLLMFLSVFLTSTSMSFAVSSTNYRLDQTVVDANGCTFSSSSNNIRISVAEPMTGQAWSEDYSLQIGFFNDYFVNQPTPTVTPTGTITPTATTTATPIRSFGGELLSEEWVYAAPNPVRGKKGEIYFDLAQPADVELKIFTTHNKLVLSQRWDAMSAGKNHWTWHADNMANGIYILYLKAKNSGKTTIIKKKIALVK